MAIGRMTQTIRMVKKTVIEDEDGFANTVETTVLTTRAYREERHGSTAWRNRASFTDAGDLFVIRTPRGIRITTDMMILLGGDRYEITNIENVKGRAMYTEILAQEVVPSGDR